MVKATPLTFQTFDILPSTLLNEQYEITRLQIK